MDELIRTNDIVLLDVVRNILEQEGIPVFVADGQMSAIEGGIGAFPRRLLVASDWIAKARRLVVEAGLEAELREP